MMDMLKRVALPSALVAMAAVPGMAFAQVDISAATGGLEEVGVAVAAIGVVMIAAISAGIAYRWIVAFLAK